MRLRVEVLSGSREGFRRVYEGPRVTVGRDPAADLQFDPEEDRAVSARHAALVYEGGRWLVRDLGSRNGTFVDGERVEGERPLRSDDRVQFGTGGPRVRVHELPAGAESGGPAAREPPDTRPMDGEDGRPASGESRTPGSRTAELRRKITRRGRGLVTLSVIMVALVGLGAAYVLSDGLSGSSGGERPAPDPRADSALTAANRELDSLRGRVAGLQEALRSSRRRVASIREKLRRARREESASTGSGEADGPSPEELQRRLDSAVADLRRRRVAVELDFSAIEADHWRALARVFVQGSDGRVATATGFSVRSDGLLITSRHAVLEEDGTPAPKIGVQFARSDQVWPGKLVATTDGADLALLRVENVVGEVPTITELSARPDTLSAGSPVAVMGYSRKESAGSEESSSGRLPRPGIDGGILVGKGGDLFEVRGFGAKGGSGSPIFDASGQVIGVLRGGTEERGGQSVLVAVPAPVVRGLLSTVLERREP